MQVQPSEPELNIFYDRFRAAIAERKQVSNNCFVSAVAECAIATGSLPTETGKVVFVLDEYELLFGELRAESEHDDLVKYRIAHPLLGQMADFAQRNLLILLGQRPEAHSILMSHNPLSPLVRQDSFPLFEHGGGTGGSEFLRFLQAVVTSGIEFDEGFAAAVYQETSGHPFLTVKTMVDLFEWLIERDRRLGKALRKEEFGAFRRERLTPEALERSPHYSFMKKVVSSALTTGTKREHPWMFAVMSTATRETVPWCVALPGTRVQRDDF